MAEEERKVVYSVYPPRSYNIVFVFMSVSVHNSEKPNMRNVYLSRQIDTPT